MIIGHDVNGVAFTDDDIRELSECADRGDFSNLEDASDCVYGSISPISDEKKMISFEVPATIADDLDSLAKKQNMSRSNLLRSFVYEGLVSATA